MTSNDLHEITFFWPRTDANRVIVTGTFDNWSRSLRLARTSTGFTTSVKVPWNSTIAYKYFVDGKWTLDETKPRMVEPEGYVNNVYVVPSKPSMPASQGTGVPNGDSDASALEKVPILTNGHATLDKNQQGYPSQPEPGAYDSSIAEAMMSIPVDRQHPVGETMDVVPKAVEKTVEEKREDDASNSGSPPNDQTAELSAQGAVTEPGAQTEATTTKAEGEVSQTTPGGSKRPIRMPLVPVNVPSEGMANGHPPSGDETASTHKPLGLVNKPRSASADSESIPITSSVPRESEQPESNVVSGAEGNGVAPPLSGEEPKEPAPPQEVVPPKEDHAVPQTSDADKATQPTREEKPIESAALPKPINGKESSPANGTPSRPSDSSGSIKARFPRVSRESSDSRPKSLPNGSPRKKRESFIQKIKHIFAHDKGKK